MFYTVTDDESARAGTAVALASAADILRMAVGSQLQLRHTLMLTLVLNVTPGAARSIEDLLARVQARDTETVAETVGRSFASDADPYREPCMGDDHEWVPNPASPWSAGRRR